MWALLDEEHAALGHGGRPVLIDDFVEKLDLAYPTVDAKKKKELQTMRTELSRDK